MGGFGLLLVCGNVDIVFVPSLFLNLCHLLLTASYLWWSFCNSVTACPKSLKGFGFLDTGGGKQFELISQFKKEMWVIQKGDKKREQKENKRRTTGGQIIE